MISKRVFERLKPTSSLSSEGHCYKYSKRFLEVSEVPWSVIGSGLSEREVGSGLSKHEVHGANHCRNILRGSRGSWLQIFYKVWLIVTAPW